MFFSEDDTCFSLEAAPLNSTDALYSGLWLVMAGIHEIPPHIALISDAKYYSVSTHKVDYGSALYRFINTLERKHVPTLFVKIESDIVIARNEAISSQLQNSYKELHPLKNTGNTCLAPIRNFFAVYFSPGYAHANYVFELLAMAEKQALIKECAIIFADGTNSNRITLQKYTMQQIKDKIYSLSAPITFSNP